MKSFPAATCDHLEMMEPLVSHQEMEDAKPLGRKLGQKEKVIGCEYHPARALIAFIKDLNIR